MVCVNSIRVRKVPYFDHTRETYCFGEFVVGRQSAGQKEKRGDIAAGGLIIESLNMSSRDVGQLAQDPHLLSGRQ